MRNVLLVGVLAACAGPQLDPLPRPVAEPAPTPPTAYQCGDAMPATSGTERLTEWNPCWDLEEETAVRRETLAAAQRESRSGGARTEPLAGMIQCKGLPEHELAHSPFAHRRAIAEVIAHRSGGEIRGVRILFKDVPGLTAAYMRQAIACHRARYEALGKPATYSPHDPTLVDGAEVTVSDRKRGLEVLITADAVTVSNRVFARARELVRGYTAIR